MIHHADPRDAVILLTAAVAIVTLGRNAAYAVRMWRQPALLERERAAVAEHASGAPDDGFAIHFVVPAFQEVDALPTTIAALRQAIDRSRFRATITIVTSIMDEPSQPGEVRTRAVAERLCTENPAFRVVIDHNTNPSMASAFNVGMGAVAADTTYDRSRTYVVAYNADSTAAPDSVQALGDTILSGEFPRVLQLNHSSLRNVDEMRGPSGWYAQGAAYYQTRWALGFEFDLHRRNSATSRPGPLGHSYHLKGQGLVLRLDTAVEVHGLSTETPCEDLELGFRLSLLDIPVVPVPVPVLEDTESPITAAAVTAQKRYWFSGMADVVNFHRLHRAQREGRTFRYELQRAPSLYRSAGCFLLGPVPYWVLIVGGFVLGLPWLAAIPLFNAVGTTWLIRRALRRLGGAHPRLRWRELITVPAAVLVWSLSRNIGPIQYLVSIARAPDRATRLAATQRRHIEESLAAPRTDRP